MKSRIKNIRALIVVILLSLCLSINKSRAQDDTDFNFDLQPTLESEIGKDILQGKKKKSKKDESVLKTKKQIKEEADLITFSARSIPVKDAFATLARISGMSISVGSDIRDDETIAVVEIKEQAFEEAFFTLIDA